MGFRNAGQASPLLNPLGFKRTIQTGKVVPFKSDLVQHTKTLLDGELLDRVGTSDRPQIRGSYWDGDGIRYILMPSEINLGTSHTIEFEGILNNVVEIIIGNVNSSGSYVATLTGDILRYQTSSLSGVAFPVTIDGEVHKYKITGVGTSISLTVDDGTTVTIISALNEEFKYDQIFSFGNGGNGQYNNKLNSINLNNLYTDFTQGNLDTKVEFTDLTTGDRVYGEIQGYTGSDILQSDDVFSYPDMNGYSIADGVSHYYDEALTQLAPSGFLSQNFNGKSGLWISNGEGGSVLADSDYVGEVKTNLIICDSDLTPNPLGLYAKQGNAKWIVNQTDKLLSNPWFGRVDPDNLTINALLISTLANIDSNIQFINKDPWQQLLYSTAKNGEDLTKVLNNMKFNETIQADGVQLETDGNKLYALKDEVTQA